MAVPSSIRTVDFLPEIFQTPVNRQFLAATLDQLVQNPEFKKTQGYVGRRVGPGVNAADRYVVEPTTSRRDYQLEPGVVEINPENSKEILDTITYPGINDALKLQGADVSRADRLYTSEYYAFDPFVDFDKFTNFAQYYWLPAGPLAVDVSATAVPLTDDIIVTRANGTYTFSGRAGTDPILTLVRGGNYNFEIAQNNTESIYFRVTNDNIASYVIDYEPNPTLTLVRGNTYTFNLSLDGAFPFYIKTEASLGNVNTYDKGVLRNGATTGTITFTVPYDAPATLYYSCSTEFNMRGTITIADATPGTGPGFWIQTDPGVNGRLPYAPNISSRDVLGVTNNGTDLGTVSFAVPYADAQSFYYTLTDLGTVDLITDLKFDQINNQFVDPFMAAHGGIDGITNLNGRTVVFMTQQADPEAGGWLINTQFDPLPRLDSLNGQTGSFDTQTFDQTTAVNPADYYSVWQIIYKTDTDGQRYMVLNPVEPVANLSKFQILFGTQWASTSWYKNAEGTFQEIPLLTAIKDVLYYQDGTDPEIFGQIRLIDQQSSASIDINEIIGAKNYTSPNGVVFTNGLKVTFRGTVTPISYANNTYYVEGVGTGIRLLPVENYVTPETYTQSATVPYDSTAYDVGNFDGTLNAPIVQDYLTVNRASPDLNAWTRSNRWFHIDVINAAAAYNNTVAVIDNLQRGKRPILEFRAGTRLFNSGTEGFQPVDIIDLNQTDALSNVNGSLGYTIDGYSLVNGSRVIFAHDADPAVRNQVYQVEFIVPDTIPPLIPEPIINLVPVGSPIVVNQQTVCLSGDTLQGVTFYYDGVEWIQAQQKAKTNQAPLFDVYDADGISFSYKPKYPSSTFTGSKLFSYATPSTATETEITSVLNDPVLGFQLTYLSLNNVGDIVFDNNLYKDTFVYAPNSVGQTVAISNGFVREYSDRVNYSVEIGWQTAVAPSKSRQQFQFVYDGTPLLLDVAVVATSVVPPVQLYVNAAYQEPDTYTVATTSNTTIITLLKTYVPGDVIEVDVLSNQASATAFYQVPTNLENNPLNGNSEQFTLGTIRNHYGSICENLTAIRGPINGANNTRDLGNLIPYGQQILQQASPLTLAGYFMRSQQYDIFGALDYNNREYIKFKSKLLETVISNEYGTMTVPEILDSAIADITLGRTNLNPFYWSDMLPTGSKYTTTNTTVTAITTSTFNTIQTYDFTKSNYLGLLVYIYPKATPATPVLLERGTDYTVSVDSPRLVINIPLTVGDVVSIVEYSSTVGNFVPNTPTKLGLYPKFRPELFLDTNYVQPTYVIQGHDGSITVAFGDIRDAVLLEFEKRIYDNLKTDDNPIPLNVDDVMPGFFRITDYTQTEITNILGESFLSWVGWNKLDYKAQDYLANNPFTYNYSSAGSKLDPVTDQITNINEQPLLGAWRGIYRYFYDTLSPNYTPWEMLGFSEEPGWWTDRYGPVPYTSDNLVLWDDLAKGYVADPAGAYIKPNYARPGLQNVIPVGTEGQLLNPLESVVGDYDATAFRKSWQVGDGGPVEAAWWSSSSYPFAVMRLLALTRPAEFFALFADRDDYRYNAALNQYLYNNRYRLDANGIPIYGNGTSRASYINWIVDYNQQLGLNSTDALTKALANLDVRLCYRMASFTDQQYLEVYLERSSPNSLNSSLLLPPESYNLLLYKNQPFSEISYSALIVEKVVDGYAIYGYSTVNPYFQALVSFSNGIQQTVSAGGTSVQVPAQYTDTVVQIPYGYTFSNTTMVVDFILSYGKYLETQGLIFDDRQNGYTLDWNQMAAEFLYFSQQGWSEGTMINLNPVATTLRAYKAGAIVDTIISMTPENMLLDQNRGSLPTRDLVVDRNGNEFKITSTTNQTISYLALRFTNYEHMVVLDNRSIFNDLIYDTVTAARQNRIRITASTTTEWTGELNAKGFIYNDPRTVQQWQPYIKYTKGEIVLYKNQYWQAANIVQPKATFDFNDWYISNYTAIQRGLLPNIANKADQLANSYNVNTANLARDNDLLSYGLIGFRPREYMAALNLDDVTQVQLYQQFLGTKGTNLAAELFTRADLGKETGAYNIYENWGVLAATYGANANKSFYELQLNQADLQADPATIQVIQPGETSAADQTVYLANVWRESFKLPSTDILPTTYDRNQETALPSAGYVNIDDVDITVYSLDDPGNIATNIAQIGVGTTIWVAKINSYDWGIYRCSEDPGVVYQIQDNLNGTAAAYFTVAHNLKIGDLIILKGFAQGVDGVYRVLGVPSITSIIIAYSFYNTNQTTIASTGLVFYLESRRVKQASDVVNLNYAKDLKPGAKVWVDNNGSGHWEVLEKTNPFSAFQYLIPIPLVNNSRYGTSVSQNLNHFAALVGMPGTGTDPGAVHTYRRNTDTSYTDNIILTLNATNVVGYGASTDFGGTSWAAVGAPGSNFGQGYVNTLYLVPGSNNYKQTQLLVAPDQEFNAVGFGSAVVVSSDDRWMFVSSPGVNRVYAYTLVDVEAQEVDYIGDGITTKFNFTDYIQYDSNYPDQIVVTVNRTTEVYAIDYTITTTDIVFATAPIAGSVVRITRRSSVQLDQAIYYNVSQNATSGGGAGAEFTVQNTRGVYFVELVNGGVTYMAGDTITIDYTQVCPAGSAANNLTLTVTSVYTGGIINEFTISGTGITNTSVFSLAPYLYTVSNIYSFTVTVNGALQRPHQDYDFNTDSTYLASDLVFVNNPPAGAIINVEASNYWQYVDTISTTTIGNNPEFGSSISVGKDARQIIIGAPGETAGSVDNSGAVYVFDRSVVAYQVTDAAQTTYSIPGSFNTPVAVLLNGTFLTNTAQFLNGQYTVSGSNIIISSNVTLTIGDVIEIETNQFQLIQKFTADYATPRSNFYGTAVKFAHDENMLFIGSPRDTNIAVECGSIYSYTNQAKEYGVITSTIANPTLTAGDTVRINDYEVAVPAYPNNTIEGMVAAINTANVPNAIAVLTPDLTFVGDAVTKAFYIGSLYSVAASYTTVVYVDTVLQNSGVDYTYNPTTEQINFITPPAAKAVILVVSGRMTITVKNNAAAPARDKLNVLPGVIGTAFADIGFETYTFSQEIKPPVAQDFAYFGSAIDINTDGNNLVIGAPNATAIEPVVFDGGTTFFDEYSTIFSSPIINSGVVYTYDYLPSSSPTVANPDQFVFGQQIFNNTLRTGDLFGTSVNYTSGRLLAGAPGGDVNVNASNYGQVNVFDNTTDSPAWKAIHVQQPAVDVDLITDVYAYDKLLSKVTTYFDYINPLQGKILGAARRNIDYIGAVDPAAYNQGSVHNNGNSWASEHLGEIWWDTDTVRFIDPNQDDIVYASRRWSQVFPGSRVDIYQWISSSVPPSLYAGEGTPLSTISYTINTALNQQNIVETTYYFWVRGITTIETGAGKTLSTTGIAGYIESPRTSGIPFLAPLNSSTVAIYNALNLISAQDTILHIGFDRQATGSQSDIHQEFQFVTDGRPDSFLNDTLYRKLQDSFCGVDTAGNLVPDPTLSPAERYGVQFRPRQSMFANRYTALKNYLTRVNYVLSQFPITESRSFDLLNSSEPEPTSSSGAWNKRVANLEELSYQDLNAVALGYKYLVVSDSSQAGRWTIYEVVVGSTPGLRTLNLVRIQNYDTPLYWNYINWYQVGYNSSVQPLAQVPNRTSLDTLSLQDVPVGGSAKVDSNGQGKFEIYLRTDTGWTRVGLQDGTIEFKEELWNYSVGNFGFDVEVFDSQYFDQEPVIETRKIIQAINQQLLIDDLAVERNSALILMFNYIYTEQAAPEWLMKTSLIDVDHKIRALLPFQMYMQDNQTFVLDYIQEVKPYHVQVREFNLVYYGQDTYPGNLTDFDVPAYYDTTLALPQYVSPILLPYDHATTTVQSNISDRASNSEIWTLDPWKQWFNNYLLSVNSITIINGGVGYITPPVVTVTGDATVPAVLTATINSAGQVVNINIVDPGQGYSVTPTITITGGSGVGARAVALMGNDLVRSIKTTIKYDRCEYSATVVAWQPNDVYTAGTLVRYANIVWSANETVSSAEFITTDWTLVSAGTLSAANRTMGYYLPTANEPGLELPLLIDGISYPGVQVTGPSFDQNTGYDVGNFDINPFDNISLDANGLPTYDYGILDTFYESFYGTPATGKIPTGTATTDINVDGGAYVDTYSSHAPQELVPGAEFDTLDMRIYTTPGSDWSGTGHGFAIASRRYTYNPLTPISFEGLLPYPFTVFMFNINNGVAIEPDVYDWANFQLIGAQNTNPGDTIEVVVTGIGGGNQLYLNTYLGSEITGGNTIVVPFPATAIYQFAIYNGEIPLFDGYDYTWTAGVGNSTIITFTNTYGATDRINLCALGYAENPADTHSYSLPIFEIIVADGNLTYDLANYAYYGGTNIPNLLVERNGVRARPYEGGRHIGDNITVTYNLPWSGDYAQSLVADNDVSVYVDQTQLVLNVDYFVNPDSYPTPRTVTLTTAPAAGSVVLISVRTAAQYFISGNQITFRPSQGLSPQIGDRIVIVSWNDTSEQGLYTQVFVGPTSQGITVSEGYDETLYDAGTVTGDPGSFSYSTGAVIQTNRFDTGRLITQPERLLVTLNGNWLAYGIGYSVDGTYIVIEGPPISPLAVLVITSMTQTVVNSPMAFRIFQDMRGLQAIYRITPETTTTLAQPLAQGDDVIYLTNASAVGQPEVDKNIWGVLTIDGERIMYRERDTVANTVSSLLRGTAGTAAADHDTGALVYDMGEGNLAPVDYQNYIVSNIDTVTRKYPLGDGSTTTFATNINLGTNFSGTDLELAVEVYVGGTLITSGYTFNSDDPVSITFDTAPAAGSQVAILVRRGVDWYNPGPGTPSDGVALQDTENRIARFLRGL